jgi:hypothetical protein
VASIALSQRSHRLVALTHRCGMPLQILARTCFALSIFLWALAQAKLRARAARIKKVRQRVALSALALAMGFSAVAMTRPALDQPKPATVLAVQKPVKQAPSVVAPEQQGSWTSTTTSAPVVTSQS